MIKQKNAILSKLVVGGGLMASSLLSPVAALAAEGDPVPVEIDTAIFKVRSVEDLIRIIVNMILIIAGVLVFAFMLVGGIQYISSGGDKVQAQSARDKITYAIIGLVIIVAAYAVAKVLEVVFGINIFNFNLPVPAEEVVG